MSVQAQQQQQLPNAIQVLAGLVERGWIPLLHVGILLDMKDPRGAYYFRKKANPLPTVRVGHVYRVNEADVVELLENPRARYESQSRIVLSLYHTAKHRHARAVQAEVEAELDLEETTNE